jgi:dihydrofolate reductase
LGNRRLSLSPGKARYAEDNRRRHGFQFDLLLGRKTYEIFAAYWPYQDENAPHGSIAKLFDEIKKYAISRSSEVDASWQGSVILRDIAEVKRTSAAVRSRSSTARSIHPASVRSPVRSG